MNHLRIVSRRIPYIPVTVTADSSLSLEADALVDTGDTGFVVVPAGSFTSGKPPTHRVTLRKANNATVTAPAYRGALTIGVTRLSPVLITELGTETAVGMQVLQSFTLTLDHGREIALEP
jgi:predicted aspartyl protease